MRLTSHVLVSALQANIKPLKAFSLQTKVEIKAIIEIATILTQTIQARNSNSSMRLNTEPTIEVGQSDQAELILSKCK